MIFRSLDSFEEEYRVITQGDVTFIYSLIFINYAVISSSIIVHELFNSF